MIFGYYGEDGILCSKLKIDMVEYSLIAGRKG
jgi:hypothetical protein